MAADRTTGFTGLYFETKDGFYHFLFKAVLILVITQQIYFPQEMKYFHLALIVTYMLFKCFFTSPFQRLGEQTAFLICVTGSTLTSVLQQTGILESGIPYLIGLITANFLAIRLMVRVFNTARTNAHTTGFTNQHQLKTGRDRGFVLVLSALITATLMFSMVYQGGELLTLWF